MRSSASPAAATKTGIRPSSGVLKGAPDSFDMLLAPAERHLIDFAKNVDGGSVALVGNSGTGKTRLLSGLVEKLRAGHTVSIQSSKPMERNWPYAGVSAFMAGLEVAAGDGFDALLRTAIPGVEGRNAVASELLYRIRARRNHDRVIVLDDFDLLDAISQEVLGFVMSRLAGTGLRVVVSVTGPFLPDALAGTPTVDLGELSTQQLSELCAQAAGPAADPSALHMIALASHGNPAFALSVLNRLPTSQINGLDPLILPFVAGPNTSPTHLASTAETTEQQQWLLQLLSTARTTPRLLIETLAAGTGDLLEELEHAGLVETSKSGYSLVTIADARTRSTTYWAMTPDQRRLLHQQLAEHANNDFEFEALWHRSFLPGAASLGITMLETACSLAELSRPIDAVEYAERALIIGGAASPDFAPLGARLALLLVSAGEFAGALRYSDLASGYRLDPEPRINLAFATDTIAMTTRLRATTNTLEQAVREVGQQTPDLAIRTLIFKALFHLEIWETSEASEVLAQARELFPHVDDKNRELHWEMTRALASLGGQTPSFDVRSEITVDARQINSTAPETLVRARSLTHAERYAEAGHLLDIVLDSESELPATWRQVGHSFAMENEILAGNHTRALARFEMLSPLLDNYYLQSPTQILLKLWQLHASGDSAGAVEFLAKHRSGNQFSAIGSMKARAAAYAGHFALMRGDFDAAVAQLTVALRSPAAAQMPQLLRASGDAIEALVFQGSRSIASRFLARLEKQAKDRPSRWLLLTLARARAVVGGPESADANFAQARAVWTPQDGHFELGRIHLAYAQVLLNTTRSSEGLELLQNAAAEFTVCGAPGWAQRCTDLLHRPGSVEVATLAPTAEKLMDTLTEDERAVVRRVLEGQRNKEIAREVHVSLRTVELRLTNVYRKVGARSRSHLAALMTANS